MAQVLTARIASARAPIRLARGGEDPLEAMRGIIRASVVSLLFFWLPLAIAWRW
jgi:hypothetical protein